VVSELLFNILNLPHINANGIIIQNFFGTEGDNILKHAIFFLYIRQPAPFLKIEVDRKQKLYKFYSLISYATSNSIK
jgi:hypothetical protein